MMYAILVTILFSCSITVSADETAFLSVSNNAGNEYKILHSAPVFEVMFENVTAKESTALKVLCSATGDLPITYEWLDPDQNEISSNRNQSIYTVSSDNGSLLHIPKVTDRHAGLYSCSAANENGLSSRFFNIIVINGPKNDSESNITASIINVQARVKSDSILFEVFTVGNVETIFVQYSEMLSPTIKIGLQWKFGGRIPYEVKDLIPSGNYSFQFKLSEKNEWSKPYAFVMLPDVPDVILNGFSDGVLKIEWFVEYDTKLRDTIDKHELSYYTMTQRNGKYWTKSHCEITVEIPKCSGSNFSITPLYKNLFYEIRLRAHTSQGYGEPYYLMVHP